VSANAAVPFREDHIKSGNGAELGLIMGSAVVAIRMHVAAAPRSSMERITGRRNERNGRRAAGFGPSGLIAYKCAPALLAGCTIILKASPEAPGAAYLIAEACENIGLSPGVLNIVTAERQVSELLVRYPDVDKVTFTGSTAAGRRIASICGDRIARCTLELGGKSAAVILGDYDIETAAKTNRQPGHLPDRPSLLVADPHRRAPEAA
jgi:hypothetical protein